MDYALARSNMVESQIRTSDVTDTALQDVLRRVERETLVPADKACVAYADTEVEFAPGRWLLKPRDAAKLIQALRPQAGQTVLAISAPYAAAVLADLGLTVTAYSGEDLEAIPAGPFDLIIVEGGSEVVPDSWTTALAVDGTLGVVIREGRTGQARLYRNVQSGVAERTLFDAMPPVNRGLQAAASFQF